MIGICVLQGRHCLIYNCQTRGVRNEKYITLDGVAPPNIHLMELCNPGELGIKVNATES